MDPVVAGTLAWCNDRRAEKQLEPLPDLPKGKREDPTSCPCGAATGLYVDNTSYGATRDEWEEDARTPLPVAVVEFVSAFDAGRYPEYDLDEPFEEDEDGGET